MQLQVECNRSTTASGTCLVCSQRFELAEARIIVCDAKGSSCGDVCPQCIAMGPNWLWKSILGTSSPSPVMVGCE
jgi:predicted amidophosphoribosyltransferase